MSKVGLYAFLSQGSELAVCSPTSLILFE